MAPHTPCSSSQLCDGVSTGYFTVRTDGGRIAQGRRCEERYVHRWIRSWRHLLEGNAGEQEAEGDTVGAVQAESGRRRIAYNDYKYMAGEARGGQGA